MSPLVGVVRVSSRRRVLMSDETEPPDFAAATLLSPQARSAQAGALPSLDAARYRVDDGPDAELGRGGQGVVLRARDELLRREVALKVLRRDAAAEPAVVASFLREARLTALLAHPGIVPLHDLGVGPGGTATLVLRRIEGKSLSETLAASPGLDARLALVPAVLRDAMWSAFEQGDFATASQRAERLEAHGDDAELALLAAVLAGAPVALDAFGEGPEAAPDQLAFGLALAAHGRFHDAAAALRRAKGEALWFQLGWPAHPRPALVLPEPARPAFERFLADFTRAFGAADHAALADSVEAFAAALDALP